MKNIILITFLTLIACTSNENNNDLQFMLIGKGELYGNGMENIEKSNFIIENDTSWKSLISKMNAVNNVSVDFKESDIDFSKYQIIAVFDQIYGNGGHSIEVARVIENEASINIKVNNLKISGYATMVMTQPFHIVKIPKTGKQIIFQ